MLHINSVDLNNPRTAVRGIRRDDEESRRKDLNDPRTAVRGIRG
jgi:hypothetical protein